MQAPEQQSLFAGEAPALEGTIIFTIGHSTRRLEELVAVLLDHRIERLTDIRHFPSSRHNPQFNRAVLEEALTRNGIEYIWLERLGGYRTGGYVAYMQTPDFAAGIETLQAMAREKRTAFMCAEVKWFKCHRRHVSDVLAARGWQVIHIFDEKRVQKHALKTNTIRCN